MNPNDEELLSAYLDGEVTAEEQACVERRLAEDAGYRQLHDELRALRQHFEALPQRRLPADFAQGVLRAAERQMVAPRRDGMADSESKARSLPAPAAPEERRWARPLAWSALIVAAGIMVMIFSPGRPQPGNNVARNQPAAPHAAREKQPEMAAAKAPDAGAMPREMQQFDTPDSKANIGADGEAKSRLATDELDKSDAGFRALEADRAPQNRALERQAAAQSGAPVAAPAPAGVAAEARPAPGPPVVAASPPTFVQDDLAKKDAKELAEPAAEESVRSAQPGLGGIAARSAGGAGDLGKRGAFGGGSAGKPEAREVRPASLTLQVQLQAAASEKDWQQLLADTRSSDRQQSYSKEAELKNRSNMPADQPAVPGGGKERLDAAEQVHDLTLSRAELVELLAQLRSRPGVYEVAAVPDELARDVKQRAEVVIATRAAEKAKQYKLAVGAAEGQKKSADKSQVPGEQGGAVTRDEDAGKSQIAGKNGERVGADNSESSDGEPATNADRHALVDQAARREGKGLGPSPAAEATPAQAAPKPVPAAPANAKTGGKNEGSQHDPSADSPSFADASTASSAEVFNVRIVVRRKSEK